MSSLQLPTVPLNPYETAPVPHKYLQNPDGKYHAPAQNAWPQSTALSDTLLHLLLSTPIDEHGDDGFHYEMQRTISDWRCQFSYAYTALPVWNAAMPSTEQHCHTLTGLHPRAEGKSHVSTQFPCDLPPDSAPVQEPPVLPHL